MKFICFFSNPPKCNLSKIKRKLHRKLVRDLDKNVLYCVMVLFSLSLFFFSSSSLCNVHELHLNS